MVKQLMLLSIFSCKKHNIELGKICMVLPLLFENNTSKYFVNYVSSQKTASNQKNDVSFIKTRKFRFKL